MTPPEAQSSSSDVAVSSTCGKINISPEEFHELRASASAAKATAHCPYSRFRVGAAVLVANGSVVAGANVENASYPVGLCAERVALSKAVTDGTWSASSSTSAFRAIAVSTDISPPASPCGMCRQFIREFCPLSMPVIMFDKNDEYVVLTLEELLPMSFGPDQLPPAGAPGAP
ncbi:Cytidine deaminase [Drechmeria coniospora]|uniref:Cytidine deaminase n=1 Tax=Drechmeria coniospora TaxID=98403 RepID=A0A151GIN1_DRECN|nr:Cytidine deaminase [Drechmeria coniospora]KYK56901.1 Cytidine deaminase [Drechmeria coniospora]